MKDLNWRTICWGLFTSLVLGTMLVIINTSLLVPHHIILKRHHVFENLIVFVPSLGAGFVAFGNERQHSMKNSLVLPALLTFYTVTIDFYDWLNPKLNHHQTSISAWITWFCGGF